MISKVALKSGTNFVRAPSCKLCMFYFLARSFCVGVQQTYTLYQRKATRTRCSNILYLQIQKIENSLEEWSFQRKLFSNYTISMHGKQRWIYFFEEEDCIGLPWTQRLSQHQPYKIQNTSITWIRPTEPST